MAEQATLTDAVVAQAIFIAAVIEAATAADSLTCAFLWNLIDDAQNANWTTINDSNGTTWSNINSSGDAGWTDIPTIE